jgi:hypothetical protein
MNLNICVSNRDAKFSLVRCYNLYVSADEAVCIKTDEAVCIKNTLTDQIDLGHLISKHEMFCFEKTVFKTFERLLEYLIFRKTL